MSRASGNFWAFVAGVATGAIVGILYAPDKGANTRDKLSYQLDKYKSKLEELISELMDEKEKPLNKAKSDGQKVVTDAKEKAERLLDDVDDLIGQLKSKHN
jgi:gas vesicle protein